MSHRRPAVLGAVLALVVGGAVVSTPAGAGPVLWVRATGEAPAATRLHLQPGFATVIRGDHRVDTVAIGDPRLVTATMVRRGQDAFDLVLQPQTETGTTNMIVWYGDLATVWMLEIGPGPRTADLVHVVTAGVTSSPRPPAGMSPPPAPPVPAPRRDMPPAPHETPAQQEPRATPSPHTAAPSQLEIRQSVGEVTGVFQATRIPDGVMIKYRITNSGRSDLVIRPGSVLVKVNGRVVAYGMTRDSIDRGRPDVLPRGATETGMIDAPGAAARQVQVVFSLFPATPPDEPASGTELPVTFQPSFNEVDRLAISPAS